MKNTNKRRRKNPALNRTRKIGGGAKWHPESNRAREPVSSTTPVRQKKQTHSTRIRNENPGTILGVNRTKEIVYEFEGKKLRGESQFATVLNESNKLNDVMQSRNSEKNKQMEMEQNKKQKKQKKMQRQAMTASEIEPSACTIM